MSPFCCICTDSYYVTWGARNELGAVMAPGQTLPPHGRPLGKLNSADLSDVIKKVCHKRLICSDRILRSSYLFCALHLFPQTVLFHVWKETFIVTLGPPDFCFLFRPIQCVSF